MLDLADARRQMIDRQIAGRGISDRHVIDAMGRVPREAFVEPGLRTSAYDDRPLPIGDGQTISQPYIVALMIEAAAVRPGDQVLEIGTGSGYAAAILAGIGARVVTIERHEILAEKARERLKALGYEGIEVKTGDGTFGWPAGAPFDAILAAAGGPAVPQSLKDQLAIGGRLVMPVGNSQHQQTLLKLVKTSETAFTETSLGLVAFVPLIGDGGWPADTRLR